MSTTYSAGIATAYGAAVRGGYTGTYAEWCALMADYGNVGQRAEQAASTAAVNANRAEQAAMQSGWMEIEINNDGHLIYSRTGNAGFDLALNNGHLYVMEG